MDFKPKNDVLTVVCEDCGKKKPAEGATEHSQAMCHCPAVPSNVIKLKTAGSDAKSAPQAQSESPPATSKPAFNLDNACANANLFGPDYEVLEELGTGSLTKAYKARRKDSGTPLVIKVLRSEFGDNPRTVKRFRLEAERACNLNHPNVAAVYDVGTTSGGLPFIVTDYLEGINIDEYLKKEGFFSEHEAIDVFIQVCDGLRDAHKKGLIHRDLKPKNIILKKTGKDTYLAKVADFGIAKVLPNPGRETKYFTPDGDSFGDAQYMSPEQCMGKRLDARSDIYALGCLMYQCISGKPPFTSSNPMRLALKQLNDAPPPLSERFVDLDISAGIEHVIMRALEKDPDNRYQSVAELSKDLALVKMGKTPRPVPRREVPISPEASRAVPKSSSDKTAQANGHQRQQPANALHGSPSGRLNLPGRRTVIRLLSKLKLLAFVRQHRKIAAVLAVFLVFFGFSLIWSAIVPHTPEPMIYHQNLEAYYTPNNLLDQRTDVFGGFSKSTYSLPTVIKSIEGKTLFVSHADTLRQALEQAVARGINLAGADFTGAYLPNVKLQNALLTGAQFSKANLQGADFTGADLAAAQFSQANLSNANMTRTILVSAVVSHSNLDNLLLHGTILSHSIWNSNTNIPTWMRMSNERPYFVAGASIFPMLRFDDRNQTGLRQIKLQTSGRAVLFTCTANSVAEALTLAQKKHIDLASVDLRGIDLDGVHLENANLRYADLEGAKLTNCHLDGADLTGALMQGTTISHSTLRSANLRLARMQGAFLSNVDFDRATFQFNDCSAATFLYCSVKDAQFESVNFAEADGQISQMQSEAAQWSGHDPSSPFHHLLEK